MSAPFIGNGERGTPLDLAAAAARLVEVARIAYGEAKLAPLPRSAAGAPFAALWSAVLSRVYRAPSPETSGLAYLADLVPLAEATERQALAWLRTTLDDHRVRLDRLEARLREPGTLAELRGAATQYFQVVAALPAKVIKFPVQLGGRAPAGQEFEPPAAREAREREAAALLDDELARILGAHPRRLEIFRSLADGEEAARATLDGVFLDARSGIDRFGASLEASHEHVWRYPPIVLSGLAELGLLGHPAIDPQLFARFMVEQARLRSEDVWDQLFLTAGMAVAVAGVVVAGPVGVVLVALDTAISGMAAYRAYERAQENQMAAAASALREGRPLTDRPSDYGDALLAGAAALLSAVQFLGAGVRLYRQTKAATEVTTEALEAATAAERTLDPGVAAPRQISKEAEAASEAAAQETRAAGEALPERGFTPTDEGRGLSRGSAENAAPVELETPLEALGHTRGTPPASRSTSKVTGLESGPQRRRPREVGEATQRKREREQQLARLRQLEDNGIVPPGTELTGPTGGRRVVREESLHGIPLAELWKRIRGKSPTRQLRQWAQRKLPVGSPDPVFPGRIVDGAAQADHIIPVDRIRELPGFAQLDQADQLRVLNTTENFEALSPLANRSKGQRLPSEWAGHKGLDLPVDEAYLRALVQKEHEIFPLLQERINELLRARYTRAAAAR